MSKTTQNHSKESDDKCLSIYKGWNKVNITAAVIALVATIVRIILASFTPLTPLMAEKADDAMLMDYTKSIVEGNWLGNYNMLTLGKRPGYSLLFALPSLTGISYQILFICLQVIGSLVFVMAIRPLVRSKTIGIGLYIFMLFMPALMAWELFQRTYRMGIVIPFIEVLFSSYIAIYLRREKSVKTLIPWMILASVTLAFFYILKEDSVWVFPFVIAVSLILFVYWAWSVIKKKPNFSIFNTIARFLLLALPFVCTIGLVNIIAEINYQHYGERTICERSDSAFSKTTSLFLSINAGNSNRVIWVPQAAMARAIECSDTLKSIEPQIWAEWAEWENDGEIIGDHTFWVILFAYDKSGVGATGKDFDAFWSKVANELESAFKDGRLQQKPGFRISANTQPIMSEDVSYLARTSLSNLKMLLSLRLATPSYNFGTGTIEEQKMVADLARGPSCVQEYEGQRLEDYKTPNKWVLDINANYLTACKAVAIPATYFTIVLLMAVVGLATFGKSSSARHALLIVMGLALSAAILVISVSWFTSPLVGFEEWASFMYCAGVYPLVGMASSLLAGLTLQALVEKFHSKTSINSL